MIQQVGFQVEGRVWIQINALSATQQAAFSVILRNKQRFVALTEKPGAIIKLSESKSLFALKFGKDMRIVYTDNGGDIFIRDVVHQKTLEYFFDKKNSKASVAKKSRGKTLID